MDGRERHVRRLHAWYDVVGGKVNEMHNLYAHQELQVHYS